MLKSTLLKMFTLAFLASGLAQENKIPTNNDVELFAGGSISFKITPTPKGTSIFEVENNLDSLVSITFLDTETKRSLVSFSTDTASREHLRDVVADISISTDNLNGQTPMAIIDVPMIHRKAISMRLEHANGESFEYTFTSQSSVSDVEVSIEFEKPVSGKFFNKCRTIKGKCNGVECSKKCCTAEFIYCLDCVGGCKIYCSDCYNIP